MSTIPTCIRRTLSSTDTPTLLDDFHDWLDANPGNFTLSNVVGATVTSFTATHTDGWQVNWRVSGTTILMAIAPTGGIADSAAPAATDMSPEEIAVVDISGSAHAQYLIALYDDAITLLTKAAANDEIFDGFHVGKVMAVSRANYPALGRDGLGMLCGGPSDNNFNVGDLWFSTSGNIFSRRSKIHVATGQWGSPLISNISSWTTVSDSARFHDVPVFAPPLPSDTPNTANSPAVGILKYITGDGALDAAQLTLINSASSTQAYVSIGYPSSGVSRLRMIWTQGVAV